MAEERLSWRFRIYSGPAELISLRAEDPELGRLFLSGLWWWLRAVSLGLFHLLRGLTLVIGHAGVAIIALAGAVKLLLLPVSYHVDAVRPGDHSLHVLQHSREAG